MEDEQERKEKPCDETIRRYCEEQDMISPPLLQRKFKLSYQEAKKVCDRYPEKKSPYMKD